MPKTKNTYNKKIFSMLLEKARGDRTTRQFANDCGISYVQMHKLELCGQENPPTLKLLTKIAENSAAGVDMEDLMFAAGLTQNGEQSSTVLPKRRKAPDIQSMYEKLSAGQQKTVYDFVDYLLNFKS